MLPSQQGAEGAQGAGRGQNRTADSGPLGCPITRGIMLNNRTGGAG